MGKQEQKIQTKIIRFLESRGFVVINVIVAGRAGESDLIACAPNGRFFAVEVKDDDKPKKLQAYKIQRYIKNNGVAIWCDSYENFLEIYTQREHELI